MAPDARQKRRITILGSTGSIGTSTLDVVRQLGGRERYEVLALTGNGNVDLLAAQAKDCGARLAVTADESRYGALKEALAGSGIEAAAGRAALLEAASDEADWVMAAIVGTAGLAPTLAAAKSGGTGAKARARAPTSCAMRRSAARRRGSPPSFACWAS